MTGGAAHTNSLPFTRSRLGSAWGHTVNNHNTAHCHLGATACPAYLSSHMQKLLICSFVNICCCIRWAVSGCQTFMAQGLLLRICSEHVTGAQSRRFTRLSPSYEQKSKIIEHPSLLLYFRGWACLGGSLNGQAFLSRCRAFSSFSIHIFIFKTCPVLLQL